MAEMISFHLDVVSAEGKLFSGRVQSAQVSGSKVSWVSATVMLRC
jgi:F-type H+-transporting ATPase subunit epsilon